MHLSHQKGTAGTTTIAVDIKSTQENNEQLIIINSSEHHNDSCIDKPIFIPETSTGEEVE